MAGSAGPAGYPDYQRVSNWDPGAVSWTLTGAQAGIVRSPILQTTSWAALALSLANIGAAMLATIQWFADQAGTVEIGRLDIPLDPAVSDTLQLATPHLGPWVQITLQTFIPGANWNANTRATMTNRTYPATARARGPYLFQTVVNLTAGANIVLPLLGYGAGSVNMYVDSGATSLDVTVSAMDRGGVYRPINRVSPNANVQSRTAPILPLAAAQVTIANLSGTIANNTGQVTIASPIS